MSLHLVDGRQKYLTNSVSNFKHYYSKISYEYELGTKKKRKKDYHKIIKTNVNYSD